MNNNTQGTYTSVSKVKREYYGIPWWSISNWNLSVIDCPFNSDNNGSLVIYKEGENSRKN